MTNIKENEERKKRKKKADDFDNLSIKCSVNGEQKINDKPVKKKEKKYLESKNNNIKKKSKKNNKSNDELTVLNNKLNEKGSLINNNMIEEESNNKKISGKRKIKSTKNDSKINSKDINEINENENENKNEMSSEDKSSSSDEDHDGLLLTSKFKKKFSDLLLKLKNKDENLLNRKEEFFHDSDFDTDISDDKNNEGEKDEVKINENESRNLNKNIDKKNDEDDEKKRVNEKILNYSEYFKDIILKEGSNVFDKEEEELKEKEIATKKNIKNYFDEQKQLKKEIIEACKVIEENDDNEDAGGDDDFFTIKKKSEKEILEEKNYYETFLKTSNIVKEENNLLKEYWKDNLNKDEEFLRDYILKEMWREDKIHNPYEEIDEIDDEELEKAEHFERTYNFRYEEQNGNIINSIPRKIENSVRIDLKKKKKKERKKEKRKKKRERKKKMLLEELKKEKKDMKNEKKNSNTYNSSDYDKIKMNENMDNFHTEKSDISNNIEKYNNNENFSDQDFKKNEKKNQSNLDIYNDENDLWFLCDECKNAIFPLNYVYECSKCENFALCKTCYKKINHEHKLKKLLIPKHCEPPKDYLSNKEIKNISKLNNNDDSMLEYLENDSSCYEDLIDDMPIRFKYIKVKPNSFNLSTDFILKTDDKTLNKIVPLKYVSPYYKKKN